MKSPRFPQRILLLYNAFVAVTALFILGRMLSSPSEAESAILLGLSLPRLALASGLFITAVFFSVLAIRTARDRKWAEGILDGWFGGNRISRTLFWFSGIGFGLGWIGSFIPIYRVGALRGYWTRIEPALHFVLLASLATLIVFYVKRADFSIKDQGKSKILSASLILFLACLAVLVGMLYGHFGISSTEDFWYGAGVPILVPQLIGAIAGGLLFLQLEKRFALKRWDAIVFVLIFVATAIAWASEPLQRSFLFIGPFQPNRVLYPFADATNFDIASQFALIGERLRIFNGYFFERPLYLSFLAYLHSFFGQDYEVLMAAQAGIFAIFPALIYLIGRSLNLRAVGFASAIVAMLRGVNAIAASNMIDMANPKMILTDFPAAIGVALVVLFACEWLKAPEKQKHFALWVGGALGLTLMLRTNALVLIVCIPLFALLKYFPDWRKWLYSSFLILLAIIAITLPWELRNRSLGGQMYGAIIGKFRAVIEQRYVPPDASSSLPQGPGTSVLTFQATHTLSSLYQPADMTQEDGTCGSVACFVPNHFLHNIVTSILLLPTSPLLDDLRHTVKESNPYWDPFWDGTFAPLSLFIFLLNVFMIVLGVVVAWKRGKIPGITPLAVFMFYNLSNAFARTSGGRYLVPMDWIITVYFLVGVFQALAWFGSTLNLDLDPSSESIERGAVKSTSRNDIPRITFIIISLIGLGALIPLSENLHARRYENFDPSKTLADHRQALADAGLDIQFIERFLETSNAGIFAGRALYPRHYKMDQGEPHFFPTINMPFPRTTFTLIGPVGELGVILPGGIPSYFPHASDVVVIGCSGEKYFDALAVIVLDGEGAVYTREPESELQCPLEQPVCTNNSVCR